MKRAALLGAALLALLGSQAAGALPSPSKPLEVRASFVPSAAEFGDTVDARIVVTMDAGLVRSSSLHVVYGIAPLTQLANVVARRLTRGGLVVVSYDVRAACLTDACLPTTGRRPVAPGPVRADVELRRGGRARAAGAWAPLQLAGRTTAADLATTAPPFRAAVTPPPATYALRPGTLAALLDVGGTILAVAAAALAASAIGRRRRAQTAEHTDELVRALRLARSARTRPEPDRRTAVGYVARVLGRRDDRLARTAGDLAWSRLDPTADAVTELVEDVEREDAT